VGTFDLAPRLPGDKSITHRAVLLALLAEGVTEVRGPNRGEDCEGTLRAALRLGAGVEVSEDAIRIEGRGGRLTAPTSPLDLGNSGTSLRLLLGVLAGQPFPATLTGDVSLCRRPVERVLQPLRAMGLEATAAGDHPPVSLTGGNLHGIRYDLPVPSAQVKSALLLAGVQATGRTEIGGDEGTRDHTERMLEAMGVPPLRRNGRLGVDGPVGLRAIDLRVPGDPSAAAFYLAAAAVVPGSRLRLEGVGLNETRTAFLDAFGEMGVELTVEPDGGGVEPLGTIRATGRSPRGIEISPSRVPSLVDELPALAAAAVFADGVTRVRGAGELRVKESDRLSAMAEGLAALGARITLLEDGWEIEGSKGKELRGGRVRCREDHRVAMSLLVAGLRCRNGVEIVDFPRIETSDPFFLENLKQMSEPAS